MRRHVIALGICIALICLLAPFASAEPIRFMNITFQSDTVGTQPGTGPAPAPLTASNPITTLQAIGGYTATSADTPPTAASGTVMVGNVGGMNQAAVLTTSASNGELGALWLDTGFSIQSSVVTLAFDIDVLAAPTSATVQPKSLDGTTAGILFGMNAFTSAGRAFMFAVAPTSADGGVFSFRTPDNTGLVPFFTYEEGKTYRVLMTADYSTGTVDAYVNNQLFLTGYHFWNTGSSSTPITSEFFFHLNGELGYSNQIAIDNIDGYNYDPVPEPASLLLLGTGLVGVAARFRRRK